MKALSDTFHLSFSAEYTSHKSIEVLSCFSTEIESEFCSTLAEVLWSVVHSVRIFLVQRSDHFAELLEANSSIVLSVDFFE